MHHRFPGFVPTVLLALIATITVVGCGSQSPSPSASRLDFSAVDGLLNVLKATVDASPDYQAVREQLAILDDPGRTRLLDSLISSKEANSALVAQIDALLSSPAYDFYYRQFRNVKPEVHRRILLALPYAAIPAPASIADNLLDVVDNLHALTGWANVLGPRINVDSCRNMTMTWLPPGDYDVPTTYFILDGNADAFAKNGRICFDLYSTTLRNRPAESRYTELDRIPLDDLHRIVAHEYHHIFAQQYYDRYPVENGDWKTTWHNRLVRRMVQEGSAMHCNPPTGFNRAIKEDTAVVAAWISSFRQELAAVRSGQVDEQAAGVWTDATYYDSASALLRTYLSRTYQSAELDHEVQVRAADRPSLVYTLGWWMVSRISHYGANAEAVRDLVVNPTTLVEKYNATIPGGADSLKFPE